MRILSFWSKHSWPPCAHGDSGQTHMMYTVENILFFFCEDNKGIITVATMYRHTMADSQTQLSFQNLIRNSPLSLWSMENHDIE